MYAQTFYVRQLQLLMLLLVINLCRYLPYPFKDPYTGIFLGLAIFKGLKIVVHIFSYYCLSRRVGLPSGSVYSPADVTVIVPSVGDFGKEFEDCIRSILANNPAKIIIGVVGNPSLAIGVCSKISLSRIEVVTTAEANKRKQFLEAAKHVKTKIIASADDHVFWPKTLLRSTLIPFNDPLVGLVGTVKRVIRQRGSSVLESFLNYLACIYLERHNFECTATYNLDGGVFVISGRTALVRADIIQSEEYTKGFLNEHWEFTGIGPLKVDDDNFTTRYMVNHGLKTVFWNQPEALMKTTLGTVGGVKKFRGQLMRWIRTTWRSNPTSLFIDGVCWYRHPWTTYAMFFSSLVNIALIYDPLLFWTLWMATGTKYLWVLALTLFLTKLVKPLPHLIREPRDIPYFFGSIVFGYLHSIFKIWALITVNNLGWTGREGITPVG